MMRRVDMGKIAFGMKAIYCAAMGRKQKAVQSGLFDIQSAAIVRNLFNALVSLGNRVALGRKGLHISKRYAKRSGRIRYLPGFKHCLVFSRSLPGIAKCRYAAE